MAIQQKGVASVLHFRLGLYDPDPDRPGVYFDSKRYADTPDERRAMRRAVERYTQLAASNSNIHLCMGIFPAYPQRARPASVTEMPT